jgi:hypothetical protein
MLRIQLVSGFQLVKIWATILRSPSASFGSVNQARFFRAKDVAPSGGESIGTLLFDERDGRTILRLTIACQSKSDRDALLAMRIDAGTLQTLENLSEYVARMSSHAG